MALLTWPSMAIMDQLRIASCNFYLSRSREVSRGSSAVYRTDLADPVWAATLQSSPMSNADALAKQALINTMEDQLGSFFVWNPVAKYPAFDPTGSKYLTSTPTVLAKNADNKRVSLQGLVPGYEISVGDFIAVPSRKCFVQVAAGAIANSSGLTGLIEVTPFIRPAVVANDAVVLIKPYMEAIIVPGQDDFIKTEGNISTISFKVIQVP